MRRRIRDLATVMQGPSRSGRAIGSRAGAWVVSLVSGNNIEDDRIVVESLDAIMIQRSQGTEHHLLRPYDVVVTAKSTSLKAALVPPEIGVAIPNSTMLAIRPYDADVGLWLWWFLTSRRGRAQAEALMVASATLFSLSPRALAELEVPVPPSSQIRLYGQLIQASELAHQTAVEAAELRRNDLREYVISRLSQNGPEEDSYAPD